MLILMIVKSGENNKRLWIGTSQNIGKQKKKLCEALIASAKMPNEQSKMTEQTLV